MDVNIQLTGSAAVLPVIELDKQRDSKPDAKLLAAVSDYGYVTVGSRSGDVILKVSGFNIAEIPTVVLCQARQMSNIDHGYSDQFAIQVIETAKSFVRMRIRRIDDGTGSSGWGQKLRVDILVID